MRIENPRFLIAAAAIALQIVVLGSSPYMVDMPWHAVWSLLAYAGLTLVLWIATDGKRPWLVPGAVMFLGACMAGLAAAAPAAIVTAAALSFFQGKPACAESSPR